LLLGAELLVLLLELSLAACASWQRHAELLTDLVHGFL
jgi:hypothetical protein